MCAPKARQPKDCKCIGARNIANTFPYFIARSGAMFL